jgi:cardiolipin synthase A/B
VTTPSTEFLTWGMLVYLTEWVIRLIMLFYIPLRRSPAVARGWLLMIFFLPVTGLVLFALIGRVRLPAWRLERQREARQRLALMADRLRNSPNFIQPRLGGHLDQAVKLADNLGRMPILGGNSAELLSNYTGAIDRLIADIDAAQQHVHLLFYIFANDATGHRVIDALARAVKRGVHCRVLMDAVGTGRAVRALLPRMAELGIAAHPMLPVGLFRRKTARYDLRNHRKIAVMDGRVGYTGSQNIVNPDFKHGLTFEELLVRVTGPIVLELQSVFLSDWYVDSNEMVETPDVAPDAGQTGQVPMQVLPSGPVFPRENNQRMFLALVHGARKRVVITTPYFVPDEALLEAMQTAVLSGVAVHLVVNKSADQILVSLAQRSYYQDLLDFGVQIHLYKERFLHAKHMSIDNDISLIGSSNMDIRSFQLNNEISLLLYDHGVTSLLEAEQNRYFAGSDLLTREEWAKRSRAQQVLEIFARMMSPLL